MLLRIATGERVEITEGNRPAFRELAEARIIYLMHTFTRGAESGYRFTLLGWEQRFELSRLREGAGAIGWGKAVATTPVEGPMW